MPHYDVTLQDLTPDAAQRASRAETTVRPTVISFEESSVLTALAHAQRHCAGRQRIVSIEERFVDTRTLSDEEVTAALTSEELDSPMEIEMFSDDLDDSITDPGAFYLDPDFYHYADDIANTLRESGLVPGLHLSLLANGDGIIDYSMIEIHDEATNTYRSRGCELKHLIGDRRLTGWGGVLSVARTLITAGARLS